MPNMDVFSQSALHTHPFGQEIRDMETEVKNQEKGAARTDAQPAPTTFNASVMAKVIVDAYMNIEKAYTHAAPLQRAFIARMQAAQGYEAVPDNKDLKGSQTALKMIAEGELTAKGIARAVESGLIRKVEAKPDQALTDAVKKHDDALKAYRTIVSEAVLPLMVAIPKGKKNVNMPTGERKRTPSKGYISHDEWNSITDAEKAQYSMTYDEVGITLFDVNGEEHYCKAFGALKRHEQGEGHK